MFKILHLKAIIYELHLCLYKEDKTPHRVLPLFEAEVKMDEKRDTKFSITTAKNKTFEARMQTQSITENTVVINARLDSHFLYSSRLYQRRTAKSGGTRSSWPPRAESYSTMTTVSRRNSSTEILRTRTIVAETCTTMTNSAMKMNGQRPKIRENTEMIVIRTFDSI